MKTATATNYRERIKALELRVQCLDHSMIELRRTITAASKQFQELSQQITNLQVAQLSKPL